MSRKRKRGRSQKQRRSTPSSQGESGAAERVSADAPARRADTPSAATRSASSSAAPRWLDNTLLGLVTAGIVLTVYLSLTSMLGEHPAYCGADSSCDLVQSSRWSTLLGVPMSLWGLLTYLLLARCLWRLRSRPSAWRFALLVATVGAAVSWYLTIVSVVQIEATCIYCLASFGIANAIWVLLLLRRPPHLPEHQWPRALPLPVGASAAVVLGLQLHFAGVFDAAAGPEDPYLKALATHLSDSGARFYGAYWCPVCQDQKDLFGASVERLPYVECTPEGRSGRVNLACVEAGVRDYPTWVIEDRRRVGVITPRELARMTRFQWDEASAQ